MSYRIFRWFTSLILALTLSLTGFMPVFAAAPTNDNFDSATVIDPSTLPFSDSLNNIEATVESGEPACSYSPQTVWYVFQPSASKVFRVDMAGSSFGDTSLNVYEAVGTGFDGLSLLGCAAWGGSVTFSAQAGKTYYFQAGSLYYGGGDLQLNLQEIPPPSNDDFANATAIPSLPFDDSVDTTAATPEAGEPVPSCNYNGSNNNTVWYIFTAAVSGPVSASLPIVHFTAVLAAYSGNSLASLTQVGCRLFGGGEEQMTFAAEAGRTYYFQIGGLYSDEGSGPMQFRVSVTPPPVVQFFFSPPNPSIFDNIQFYDQSYDVGNAGFQSFTWDFGDGTTATDSYTAHHYTKDGDYTVQHSATTSDGRTASTSQAVQVRTHDVAITKILAPKSATSGQTREIDVSIRNYHYPETVQVDLYRSISGGGFELIASSRQFVPVRTGSRTTQFAFNYTFTSKDAQAKKVVFRAVATIVDASDALPTDNEAISAPTTVNK